MAIKSKSTPTPTNSLSQKLSKDKISEIDKKAVKAIMRFNLT